MFFIARHIFSVLRQVLIYRVYTYMYLPYCIMYRQMMGFLLLRWVTHSMAGATCQLNMFGLAHHDPSILYLVSHNEEDVPSKHMLYLPLLVLEKDM